MNADREKELFRILGNLVGGVKKIQETLDDHSGKLDAHSAKLDDHSAKLDAHSAKLDDHSKILSGHSEKLDEHTVMLKSLVSKTDSIAEQVMKNDQRLTARIASVETAVENMGGEIH